MAKGSLRVNGIIVDTDGEIKASTGDSIVIREDDGSAVITVDTAGKVGINTTAPGAQFDIRGPAGTGTAPAGVLRLSTAETSVVDADQLGRIEFIAPLEAGGTDAILVGASIYAEADNTFAADNNQTEIVFATGASEAAAEKMRLTSDGKLGIGIATPASSLDVRGTMQVVVNDTGYDVKFFGATSGAYAEWDESADELELRGGAATPGKLLLSTAETTVVDGNKLGQIDFQAPLDSAGTDAILVGASIYAEADATFSSSVNATELVFATGASEAAAEKMRLTSDGNVGIGVADPTTKLHVAGTLWVNAGYSDTIMDGTPGSNDTCNLIGSGGYWALRTDNTSKGINFDIYAAGTPTVALKILQDGKVGINTTSPSALLDIDSSGDNVAALEINLTGQEYSSADPCIISANDAGSTRALFRIHEEATRSNTATDLFKITQSGSNTYLFNVLANGNVGIGTSPPGLNAGGVAAIDPSTNFGGTLLHIDNTGGDATLVIGGSDQPNIIMVDGNSSANKRYYHQTVISDVYKFRLLNDAGSLVNDNVLVLDGHNARVGIGTSAPDYPLHLATATVNVGQIIQGSYNNNANPNLTIQKSNGSIASPTAITSGHYCGQIRFNSYDGNSWHGSADIVCATSGTVADGRVAGDLRFRTAPDSVAGVSERMRITHHGRVGIGTTDPNSPLTVNLNYTSGAVCSFYQQYASQTTLYVKNSSASFAASMQYQITELNDSANGNFCWYSDTNDVKIKMNTNGDGWWDGAADNGSADYAEYFEADSDNSSAKISHGTTVVLINGKIRPATSGEQPIGIIRPHDGVAMVGNSAWSRWQRKGLRDDYGKKILEEYTTTVWTDADGEVHDVATDELTERGFVGDKAPPADAVIKSENDDGTKLTRTKQNPDWDASHTYVQRENRPEWNIVGLLGQIPITKGQPTNSNWIKMWDISDTVEMWFVK